MADNEQKAMQLIAEAEKKLTSKGFLSSLFGLKIVSPVKYSTISVFSDIFWHGELHLGTYAIPKSDMYIQCVYRVSC
ncbi:hypothetical protein TSAR_007223 [Trichomalopsis sarcophagae]|uniref:Uncharacterized protein n=1 Tax=Trichomalopsis sarcophagae TaxID=543379 RepID=A0A232ETG7_9HYME|nr:hypothetical protein TSAR_007223 [Trichomalopsis sarcophagae]